MYFVGYMCSSHRVRQSSYVHDVVRQRRRNRDPAESRAVRLGRHAASLDQIQTATVDADIVAHFPLTGQLSNFPNTTYSCSQQS